MYWNYTLVPSCRGGVSKSGFHVSGSITKHIAARFPTSVFNFGCTSGIWLNLTASSARTEFLFVLAQTKTTRPWPLLKSRVQLAVQHLGLRGRGMAAVHAGSLHTCPSPGPCQLIVVADGEK